MSILIIFIIACITRCDWAASLTRISRPSADGMTPMQTELVLQPAALQRRAAGHKLFPQFVDLGLRFTVHKKRDCRREISFRSGVEEVEPLTVEFDGRAENGSCIASAPRPQPSNS